MIYYEQLRKIIEFSEWGAARKRAHRWLSSLFEWFRNVNSQSAHYWQFHQSLFSFGNLPAAYCSFGRSILSHKHDVGLFSLLDCCRFGRKKRIFRLIKITYKFPIINTNNLNNSSSHHRTGQRVSDKDKKQPTTIKKNEKKKTNGRGSEEERKRIMSTKQNQFAMFTQNPIKWKRNKTNKTPTIQRK